MKTNRDGLRDYCWFCSSSLRFLISLRQQTMKRVQTKPIERTMVMMPASVMIWEVCYQMIS